MLWVVIVGSGVMESISEPPWSLCVGSVPWSFSVDGDCELVLVVLDVVVVLALFLVNLVLLADVLLLVLVAVDEDVALLVVLVTVVLLAVLEVLVVELLVSVEGDIDIDVVLLVVLVVRLLVGDIQVQMHPGEPMGEHDVVQHDNCRVLSSVIVNKTACNNALRWNNFMVVCGCFSLIS